MSTHLNNAPDDPGEWLMLLVVLGIVATAIVMAFSVIIAGIVSALRAVW